jgi:diguanylate cyclase (GGDEF)-like protein
MIVIDIDNFKRLNDTRGHPAGDCALQAMVSSLRGTVRAHDLVARTGGEEFAILLPDTNELGALVIADRLRQTVAALAVPFADGAIRLTICAGVAQLDTDSGWEAMMRVADAAMYQAKKHGGNRISSRIALPAINDDVRWNVAVDTRRYVQTVERDVGTIRIPDVVLDVGKSFGRQEYVRDLE